MPVSTNPVFSSCVPLLGKVAPASGPSVVSYNLNINHYPSGTFGYGDYSVTVTSKVHTGMTAGQYTAKVWANNGYGQSVASADSASFTVT